MASLALRQRIQGMNDLLGTRTHLLRMTAQQAGTGGMASVELAVGIEAPEDRVADLDQALAALPS